MIFKKSSSIFKRDVLFILIVVAYIFVFNTMIIEQYGIYVDYAVKTTLVAFLFTFLRYYKLTDSQRTVVLLYLMLLTYGLLLGIFTDQLILSAPLILKFFVRILVFVIILMFLNTNRYSDVVIKFPIIIGVILSIQSILLFILIITGSEPKPHIIDCIGRMKGIRSFGLLGYQSSFIWGSVANMCVPRLYSFFSEPSAFAQFLTYPIILSFGYYKIYREKRYIFSLCICLLCFILTFSLAGYIALFITFVSFKFFKKKIIMAPIFIIIFFYTFNKYIELCIEEDPSKRNFISHMVFARCGSGYGGRVASINKCVNVFIKFPLGVGLISREDCFRKANVWDINIFGGFFYWLVKTGFVGVSIFLLIFYNIFKKVKSFWHDKNDIRVYLAMSFCSIGIHQLVFGEWVDPMFLFIMALILAYKSNTPHYPD